MKLQSLPHIPTMQQHEHSPNSINLQSRHMELQDEGDEHTFKSLDPLEKLALGKSDLQDEGDEAVGVDNGLPMSAHTTGAHYSLDGHACKDVHQNLLAQTLPIRIRIRYHHHLLHLLLFFFHLLRLLLQLRSACHAQSKCAFVHSRQRHSHAANTDSSVDLSIEGMVRGSALTLAMAKGLPSATSTSYARSNFPMTQPA